MEHAGGCIFFRGMEKKKRSAPQVPCLMRMQLLLDGAPLARYPCVCCFLWTIKHGFERSTPAADFLDIYTLLAFAGLWVEAYYLFDHFAPLFLSAHAL